MLLDLEPFHPSHTHCPRPARSIMCTGKSIPLMIQDFEPDVETEKG